MSCYFAFPLGSLVFDGDNIDDEDNDMIVMLDAMVMMVVVVTSICSATRDILHGAIRPRR